MDVWSWICELPESPEFTESDSMAVFHLAGSPPSQDESTRSIKLRAERVFGSDSEAPTVTFGVILEGFQRFTSPATIWVSDTCPLSSQKPFLPLVLQLLRELVALSPTNHSTCPRSQLREIKPDPVDWVMDSHSPESFSSLFNLIFLTRLFWLCVCNAPSEVGSFFFQHLLGPNIGTITCQHAPVLRTFLVSVGVDAELCITRAASYALAKWLIYKEIGVGIGVGVGLQGLSPLPRQQLGFCYATEAHGLWVLKGYFPISGMKTTNSNDFHKIKFPIVEPKEAVLRYALSHQHAEAVIQLEYSVKFHDSYIRVNTRVDNIRIHVAKLGLLNGEEMLSDYADERYCPSRVLVWVGPEVGSTYVAGLSLGRSTNSEEREVELTRTLKGNFGKVKAPNVKARARMSTRKKLKDWRCDQDCDGNAAVFDAILYDRETGEEAITMKPHNNDDDHYNRNRNHNRNNSNGFKNRYAGVNRGFSKNGGVVFCGDEYGEEVGWRVGREMEGSVLKWRIGGQVWLSYWPNKLNSSFYETRCVEWCDEVDLPLVPTKLDNE